MEGRYRSIQEVPVEVDPSQVAGDPVPNPIPDPNERYVALVGGPQSSILHDIDPRTGLISSTSDTQPPLSPAEKGADPNVRPINGKGVSAPQPSVSVSVA